MPTTIAERVDRLESVFASFMEKTEEALADIRASTAEIRASNLRTDALLLEMQRQADKDRQQAEKDRQQAEKDRQQAEKDRQQADRDRQQAEMNWRQQAEKDRQQADRDRQQAEMNWRQQAEKDRQQAEKDRQHAEMNWRQQAEKDRQQAEKDRRQAEKNWRQQAEKDRQEAEKDRKDFNKRMAELSDSMGTLIEDMVAPNGRRIASEIFPADPAVRLAQRVRQVHPSDPGRMMEIDLLVAGRKHLMIVEAKRRLNAEKIREFVEKIEAIPEFMTEYAGHKLVPVVASVTIEPSVITYLNRRKVYGVAMGDETMELVNLGQF